MQIFRIKFLAALGGCLLAAASQATLIFDNGPFPSAYGGNNPFSADSSFVAQDFVVSGATSVGSITFNANTGPDTVPITAVHAAIYSDNSGAIDTMLYSGVFTVARSVFTGNNDGFALYDYTVNVPSWALGSGTYWLGLKADPAQMNLHWTINAGNAGNGPYQGGYIGDANGTPDSYQVYYWEHAFSLDTTPVPEPSTYLAGALAALLFGVQGVRAWAAVRWTELDHCLFFNKARLCRRALLASAPGVISRGRISCGQWAMEQDGGVRLRRAVE